MIINVRLISNKRNHDLHYIISNIQMQKQQINQHHYQQEDNLEKQQNCSGQQQQCQQEITESKWRKIEQPQKTVDLSMVDFNQCDSKKCTGKKLQRFKLIKNISDKKKKYKGIVLSAFGKKHISIEDRQCIQKYGICVIDCSWNRIEQTRQFRYKHERKLPFVVAGNPVNYGKPYQLSCVQALTTALCTIGYVQQAEYIISKFGWSEGFWKQNVNIVQYSKCKSMEEIIMQSKVNEESGNGDTFQRNYDLPEDEESQEG